MKRSGLRRGFATLGAGLLLAGSVALHSIVRAHDVGQLGYWLGRRFTGRGIMTRAVGRVTEHAFDAGGLHRVEILAVIANASSRALALQRACDSVVRVAAKPSSTYGRKTACEGSQSRPHGRWEW